MSRDTLGDRMKDYESVPRTRLMPRVPVLVRLDGKAFHTFTRGMAKPYDPRLTGCMTSTMLYLCEHMQGARFAYVQSDEISILLVDYQERDSSAWFDYDLQKICSVSASWAAARFNQLHAAAFAGEDRGLAAFDARAWSLPLHEVVNYFIWRQQDAIRNSVSGLAQAHFSSKRLHAVTTEQMQELLRTEKGIDWNDQPIHHQRGACAFKQRQEVNGAQRSRWTLDLEPPTFTLDRAYVERWTAPDPWPASPPADAPAP